MAKAIGIGGVFIKYKDEKAMRDWFEDVLGLKPNDYGVLFAFNTPGSAAGHLQLGTFAATTGYFGSETQQVMINFRVDDLRELEKVLIEKGVKICNKVEEYAELGKFLHIEGPEGNRIELWEPVAKDFDPETEVRML